MPVADTTFLIDLLHGDEGAASKLEDLVERRAPLYIPSIALHELYYGAARSRRPAAERRRIADVEDAVPVLPFGEEAARLAGTLEGGLERKGRKPERSDVQISAVALLAAEPILTRDRRFPRPEGLVLETY